MCGKARADFSVVSRASIALVLLGAAGLGWTSQIGYCQTSDSEAPTEIDNAQATQAKVRAHITQADMLVKEMTIKHLEHAIKEYESALELDPNSYDALWKLAYTYIYILDIKTDCLIVEKREYKPVLKELGHLAQQYAKRAYKVNPKGKEAVRANLQSYGYYSASMGIVTAVLKGAAGHYVALAKELIAIDDTYCGASAYRCLGRLYYMAPWPLGNSKKAMKFYQKASERNPDMLEPHYWRGMIYLKKKKYEAARKEFEFVLSNPPIKLEEHCISEFKKESQKQLNKIKERRP